jgi:hypothetical protein
MTRTKKFFFENDKRGTNPGKNRQNTANTIKRSRVWPGNWRDFGIGHFYSDQLAAA